MTSPAQARHRDDAPRLPGSVHSRSKEQLQAHWPLLSMLLHPIQLGALLFAGVWGLDSSAQLPLGPYTEGDTRLYFIVVCVVAAISVGLPFLRAQSSTHFARTTQVRFTLLAAFLSMSIAAVYPVAMLLNWSQGGSQTAVSDICSRYQPSNREASAARPIHLGHGYMLNCTDEVPTSEGHPQRDTLEHPAIDMYPQGQPLRSANRSEAQSALLAQQGSWKLLMEAADWPRMFAGALNGLLALFAGMALLLPVTPSRLSPARIFMPALLFIFADSFVATALGVAESTLALAFVGLLLARLAVQKRAPVIGLQAQHFIVPIFLMAAFVAPPAADQLGSLAVSMGWALAICVVPGVYLVAGVINMLLLTAAAAYRR